MKYLLLFGLSMALFTACANTDVVDDSDVEAEIANQNGSTEGDDEGNSSDAVKEKSPLAEGELQSPEADLLYNIGANALKSSPLSLTYDLKCTYTIKPLTIKSCLVKTGYLPADAKNRLGRLLLQRKLPRRKVGDNEAIISTRYTCKKASDADAAICTLNRIPTKK
jgi:hypothetical protein